VHAWQAVVQIGRVVVQAQRAVEQDEEEQQATNNDAHTHNKGEIS
jgi:hypothetical protein